MDGSGFTAMTSFAIGVDLGARGSFSVLSNGDVIFINFAAGAFNIARVPASGSGVLTLLTRGGRVQDFVVSPSEAYVGEYKKEKKEKCLHKCHSLFYAT